MRTAIAATLCLTFGCASSSPSLEKASIGSLSFGTPSGWTSRDVSSPQRKMFEWSPTDNERKESLTIIRSDRPAMAKATPVQLQHLMRDAQGVMRDASFSAPISFTTRHGFRGVRIEGSFLPRGQDVMFEYANRSPDGLWEEFRIKQPGHHYQWLRRRLAAPNDYQLKTLSGEILVYNSSGRLTELWDSLATPNKTLLVYSGGQLSTVTDATGKRRLQFLYTSNQLTTVRFQIFTISWLNKHTTTYSYTSGNLTGVTIGAQAAQRTRTRGRRVLYRGSSEHARDHDRVCDAEAFDPMSTRRDDPDVASFGVDPSWNRPLRA